MLFLCSALSKEAGLLFPLFWCAVALLRRVRGILGASAVTALAVGLIYASLRFSAEHVAPPMARHPMPLLVRPVLAARAVAEYAGLIAFPLHLSMDRDVETHPTGFSDSSITGAAQRELQTVTGILLIALLVYWLIRSRTRDTAVFVFLVLAAIAYLPCSGLVGLNATVAEHWMYLPSSFLLLATAIALTKYFREARGRSRFFVRGVAVIVSIWVLFLGTRTYLRTFDWKDQRTFFERTIVAGGDSARMHINLAGVEMNDGHFKEANKHLQEALRREPDEPLALLNLAALAIKENDFRRAHELLPRAIETPEVSAQAHELTAVLANKERGAVDLMRLRLASRTGAPNWSIEKRYIKVLAESGQVDRAIAETQACLQTQWYRAESWQLLSQLLAGAGRKQDAARAYAQAEALDVHLGDRPNVL
ncbi:MAG: tetratricopeptide repeat protein [Chthoniobacterales bacterium]|nr:tetratricopeptide repeat protein [Chthoniobacterales bacterium]